MDRRLFIKSMSVAAGGLLIPPAIAKSPKGKPVAPAYLFAAQKHDIPPELLFTLAHKESELGSINMPHPFAMNFRGDSFYFDSRSELYTNVKYLLDNGHRSFDLGPVQVNWKWHGEKFEDLWEATHPARNLNVGAAYYREQYDKCGDWFTAAGLYHSFTPEKAENYRNGFIKIHKRLGYA